MPWLLAFPRTTQDNGGATGAVRTSDGSGWRYRDAAAITALLGTCVLLCACERAAPPQPARPAGSHLQDSAASTDLLASAAIAVLETGAVFHAVSPAQFSQYALTNALPVVVMFHSAYSVPSAAMRGVAIRLAQAYSQRVQVVGVDLSSPELRPLETQYVVRSTPTFVFMRDGRELGRLVGSTTLDHLSFYVRSKLLVKP